MKNILNKDLPINDLKVILEHLFNFTVRNVNPQNDEPHYVIFDDEGDEFYGGEIDSDFNLYCLDGIFKYLAHVNKMKGQSEIRLKFKALLLIK